MKGSSVMLDEIVENNEQSTTTLFSIIPNNRIKYSRLDIAQRLSVVLKELAISEKTSELTDQESSDNTELITCLLDVIQICTVYRRMNYTSTRENTTQLWNAIKVYYFKSLNRKHYYPRAAVLDRILILYKWREALQRTKWCLHEKYLSKVHETLLTDIFNLATSSEYENIREKAKICFFKIANLFKHSHRKLIDPYILTSVSALTDPACTNNYQVIGCIEFLASPIVIKTICRSWFFASRCFHSLFLCSVDDHEVHAKIHIVIALYASSFFELPILNKESFELYKITVHNLATLLNRNNMSWNYQVIIIIMRFLKWLVRQDPKYEHDVFPHAYVSTIANSMISENTNLRIISLSTMNRILQQLKPHQPFQILKDVETIKRLLDNKFDVSPSNTMIDKPYNYTSDHLSDVNNVLSFLPHELKVYDYSKELRPSSFHDSLEVIQQLMSEITWWKRFFECAIDGDTTTSPTFRMQMTFFFKGLCQVIGPKIIDIIKTCWDIVLSISSDEPNLDFVIRLSSEIFTGCVRGSKHWQSPDRAKLFNILLPKLERMAELSSHNSCNLVVSHALAHCFRDLDYRRNTEIIDFVISKIDLGSSDTLLQTKILSLTYHALANCGAINQWYQHLVNSKLLPFLKHSHFEIRELVGSILGLGFLANYHFYIGSHIGNQDKNSYLESILQNFANQIEQSETENQFEYVCSVFFECVTRTMIRGINILTPYLDSILTILLAIINKSHNNEITLQASIVVAKIATMVNKQGASSIFMLATSNLQQQTKPHPSDSSSQWKSMILLSFLGNFSFKNQFYLFKHDDSYQTLCEAYLNNLKDKAMVIRQLASDMLCSLLRIMPQRVLLPFTKLFLTQAKALLDKSDTTQKNSQDPVFVGLGLSSIVKAFSHCYDIPTFLPNIMAQLARMSKFSTVVQGQPLQKIIRETFDIFFRLQQSIDRWEQNKTKFTAQQLETVSELLYSPSHYA
ncbi:hypothetical protein C9374_005344 [Naegleria lovaniensis]|uniref:Uncharacterized protein n=1 Tax=Naegleria lovaniensis TaxID=51637 RepID=A0AA88KIF2_NAELO|nr:uncharacterized protein C9374_005344 [Naegleria lovaniensis]KAG2382142.1 hypothetical protein C9374_005344 [Naegleria lovaniensis]